METYQSRPPRGLVLRLVPLAAGAALTLWASVWLLSAIVSLVIHSPGLSTAIAFFLTYSLGGTVAGVCGAAVAATVYRGGAGERLGTQKVSQ